MRYLTKKQSFSWVKNVYSLSTYFLNNPFLGRTSFSKAKWEWIQGRMYRVINIIAVNGKLTIYSNLLQNRFCTNRLSINNTFDKNTSRQDIFQKYQCLPFLSINIMIRQLKWNEWSCHYLFTIFPIQVAQPVFCNVANF